MPRKALTEYVQLLWKGHEGLFDLERNEGSYGRTIGWMRSSLSI